MGNAYNESMVFTFPDIDPVAFWLGPLPVRWYALAYLAGFLLGWQYCMRLAKKDADIRPDASDVEDFLSWAIIGVILGGRIGYVLFYNFDLYMHYPLEALKVWQGGMSFHGGMLGVAVALVVYPLIKKFSILRLSDMVAAAAPIGLFFGRMANFINGELYGRVTDSPLGMVFPHGGPEPRHPSQIYEALSEGLVLFIILAVLIHMKAVRDKPGIVTGAFLIGYGVFRSFVEVFREPDEHLGLIFEHISMGQILSLPMIIAGVVFVVLAFRQGDSSSPSALSE